MALTGQNRNQDAELSALSSFLDFYSNRAIAHASFVVAGIFGIYSVLIIMNRNWFFLIPYFALIIIDLYEFLNFGLYTEFADIEKKKIIERIGKGFEITDEEKEKELGLLSKRFNRIKGGILGGKRKIIFLGILWFFAVISPLILMMAS